jgi:hypothetical protein
VPCMHAANIISALVTNIILLSIVWYVLQGFNLCHACAPQILFLTNNTNFFLPATAWRTPVPVVVSCKLVVSYRLLLGRTVLLVDWLLARMIQIQNTTYVGCDHTSTKASDPIHFPLPNISLVMKIFFLVST